ncbi:MAG: phosphoribosylamine--glycine ligase [Christensenellaceae bacterium]|jgi:phosphoribosylamine--glycine ligase|nr:phosphoribosylamine--glycine ligase [Christensenellaceae bacterium]
MEILVVGSGGREHAIIKKLKESPLCAKIHCAPGNGGIAAEGVLCHPVQASDLEGILALAKGLEPDFTVVAPDDPLVLGLVDLLEKNGFACFGPTKAAARLEGSKVFSKGLMKKYGIPTARYEVFDDAGAASEYIRAQKGYPLVLKADGLALGKGVLIAESQSEALLAVRSLMEEKKFGESGAQIVIEEFLRGPEVTALCLSDGETIRPLASSMDHKRALDGDLGLNTGGMGTIAPSPLFTKELEALCMERIFQPTVDFMRAEGQPFKGCLYVGLMLTESGPYVVEYNCRFGDPEAQVVLPLLEGDLLKLMLACRNGGLKEAEMAQKPGAAACVVLASGGYPEGYKTGCPIRGLDERGGRAGLEVIHAGTKLEDGRFFTAGGRVLGLTARGDSLQGALRAAYKAAEEIGFEGCHFRRDIGRRAVEGR